MFAAECDIYTSRFGKYMHISYACLCKDWRVIFKQEVSERKRERERKRFTTEGRLEELTGGRLHETTA